MRIGTGICRIACTLGGVGLAISVACADPPTTAPASRDPGGPTAPQVAPLSENATVDQVLDALNARGKNFSNLTADVKLTDIDDNLGTEKSHVGHLWLQRPSPDDAVLHVVFDKVIEDKRARDDKKEYLLKDGWLTDRDFHSKLQSQRQVIKPGAKMNLFKLGEGPFPLPIGQDKAEVHQEFDITLIPKAANDPKDSIHLTLVPHPDTSLARRFKQIDVWVDRASDMPIRIDTADARGATDESTELQNVKINTPGGLRPADLELQKIDMGGWQVPPPEPYAQ